LGVTIGCMAFLMLQYLSGGAWGVVIRRLCEAAIRNFPILLLLFLPIAFGIPRLYIWSHADVVAQDAVLRHNHLYLNVPFFLVRAAFFFAGWILLSILLNKWSLEQDRQPGDRLQLKLQLVSGPGLVFFGFSVTFMAIDWVMSIDPHWYSSMFGLLFIAGEGLSAMAFLITVLVLLSNKEPFSDLLTARHLHDLGKLLLTFVMVWAYFSFSQFLIIWAGNLPEEIPWYVERLRGGWQYIALVLVFGHFALPFALLLSRDLKRNFKLLSAICLFILCMRVVDIYWQVMPDASKSALALSWIDFAAVIGLGGIWLGYFLLQLEKRPLMPINAEDLVETLEHGR